MRFKRFSLPLLISLLAVLVTAVPINAQKNERHAQNAKRVGRMPKEVDPSGVSPTAANYQVSQTTGVIVSGSTQVTGFFPNLDDGTASVVLPFPYSLYDQTFTSMNVSTNGNLQFVSSNPDYGQLDVCFPLAQFNYAIMPHWGDLTITGANEGVFTSITGSAPNRIFNIEWRASLIGNASGSLNFEVRLYENQTRFDFVYGTAPGGGREVTVGAERGQGATYTEFSCHQSSLRNGMMLIFNGTAATSLFIAGRVTDPDGNPVAGATVNLTGNATAMVTTDGTGDYAFPDLSSGGTYSVAATQAGFNFFPPIRNFGPGNRAFTGNFIVNFIRTTPPNAGDVIISEFRFHGQPFPTVNEFVEIQNNTNQGITVNSTNSAGWLVTTLDPSINFLIPNGTTIPARGHYLGGNGSGYNLYGYGSADTFYSGDIPAGGGVAVFSTSDPASINLANRLDAAGFAGAQTSDLFREGTGLISPGAVDGNYSFVRKLTSGNAQDTNNNGADFQFVSPDGGIYGGVQSTLGAPGPENSASPIQRNAQIKASLIDPVAGQVNPPNRVRNSTPNSCGGANCALGTLVLRRRFTNSTGQSITRLRFRIVDITTAGNIVAGQADLRALNSTDAVVTITGGGTVQVRGLTVEQGPELPDGKVPQPNGGGMNSSMVVGVINVAQPLAPGTNVSVEFRLGVQTGGSFRFFINVEAMP